MRASDKSRRFRLLLVFFFFLGAFSLLGWRAYVLHMGQDQRVARLIHSQADKKIQLTPERGSIFDRKERPLAISLKVPSFFADPARIIDRKVFSKKVGKILGVSQKFVSRKIKNKERRFVWLARHADPSLEAPIRELKLKGLHTTYEGDRLYPIEESAAQVLGAVGIDGQGLEGLERFYDDLLRSRDVTVQAKRDGRGRTIFSDDVVFLESDAGSDLFLTVDQTIQHILEKELFSKAKETNSLGAMGIVMDPKTGGVLAMASYPAPNANRLRDSNPKYWRNRPIQDVFEPGSTMKVFTMISALEDGVVDPSDIFLCRKGSLKVGRKVIRTHHNQTWMTPQRILKYSDNIGTARIGLALGQRRLYQTLKDFGFGARTGIDFPSEARGVVRNSSSWREMDLVSASFGQGFSVSAIQLASAFGALANDGIWNQPHFVRKIRMGDGRAISTDRRRISRRVISSDTVKQITKWMESVTEEDGTGWLARIDNFRVAGKTGTAQKYDQKEGRYSNKRYVSSFVGFAPVSNPRLVAVIIFDEPRDALNGGEVAAPVFSNVVGESLSYLNVPSDSRSRDPFFFTSRKGDSGGTSFKIRKVGGLNLGDDFVPDLRGMTYREVLRFSAHKGVQIGVSGSGIVVDQEPAPGLDWIPEGGLRVRLGARENT